MALKQSNRANPETNPQSQFRTRFALSASLAGSVRVVRQDGRMGRGVGVVGVSLWRVGGGWHVVGWCTFAGVQSDGYR